MEILRAKVTFSRRQDCDATQALPISSLNLLFNIDDSEGARQGSKELSLP